MLETFLVPCFLQCYWKWFWFCLGSVSLFSRWVHTDTCFLHTNTWRNYRYFSNIKITSLGRIVPEAFSWILTDKIWLAGHRGEEPKGFNNGFVSWTICKNMAKYRLMAIRLCIHFVTNNVWSLSVERINYKSVTATSTWSSTWILNCLKDIKKRKCLHR